MGEHTAVILPNSAGCKCGRMRMLIRPDGEAIGVFTLRAYAAWQSHRDDPDDGQQMSMFGTQERPPVVEGGPMFR